MTNLAVGHEYYLHARMHDPDERVTLLRVDEAPTQKCVVRNPRGLEFIYTRPN